MTYRELPDWSRAAIFRSTLYFEDCYNLRSPVGCGSMALNTGIPLHACAVTVRRDDLELLHIPTRVPAERSPRREKPSAGQRFTTFLRKKSPLRA